MPGSFFELYAPPLTTGTEKALLPTHLQVNREALLWKLEGLDEAELRRPMTDTGTNLLGLVKHLTGIEGGYFCDAFGRDRPPLAWESDEDSAMGEFSDMYAKPSESAGEIVAAYRGRCAPQALRMSTGSSAFSCTTAGRRTIASIACARSGNDPRFQSVMVMPS